MNHFHRPLKDLPIGIVENALMHTDAEPPHDLETKFRMVRDAGIFDYLDMDPPSDLLPTYQELSAKYAVPIRGCGYIYQVGRDEAMMERHLHIAASLGSKVLNVQMQRHHARGHIASNEEIAEAYARATDIGETLGCLPCFEAHVDNWSEDFKRVEQVADIVEAGGRPFRMTLDPSHVVFKIDNVEEQQVLDLGRDLAEASLVLDPTRPGNVMSRWVDRNLVWHAHARSAVPNNPKNIKAHHPDGRVGRGIQYPFIKPAEGEYHAPWNESALDAWKTAMRMLLRHHASNDASPLGQISVEFIPFPDYGSGGGYSIFNNAVACGHWLRDEIAAVAASLRQARFDEGLSSILLRHIRL